MDKPNVLYEHGLKSCLWNSVGNGYIPECFCGWEGSVSPDFEAAGADMDDHIQDVLSETP